MSVYDGARCLVAGGTGMIGRELVEMLISAGASVLVASLDDEMLCPTNADFIQCDLRDFNECKRVCEGIDIVFNLAGVKGSPKLCIEQPASFMVPKVMFSFNLMEAARQAQVKRYLYTSSIGVYAPAEEFFEDDVWHSFPSNNDRFAGWANRICELQAEAYKREYSWDNIAIVRPANVYGRFDNFDPQTGMVIPSLISRIMRRETPLRVWGDGAAVRDFVNARDVALGCFLAVQKGEVGPFNLGSGTRLSIKDLVETIVKIAPFEVDVEWDDTQPAGDTVRVMNIDRAKDTLGYSPAVSIFDGIKEIFDNYESDEIKVRAGRYNSFREFAR